MGPGLVPYQIRVLVHYARRAMCAGLVPYQIRLLFLMNPGPWAPGSVYPNTRAEWMVRFAAGRTSPVPLCEAACPWSATLPYAVGGPSCGEADFGTASGPDAR